MTPEAQREAQRIAIAEVCFDAHIAHDGMKLVQRTMGTEGYRGADLSGLWIYERGDGSLYGTNWNTAGECRRGNIEEFAKRNDYPGDLNAMHEAEKTLSESNGLQARYIHELPIICERDAGKDYRPDWHCSRASAIQRAEAFLRAQGLWT